MKPRSQSSGNFTPILVIVEYPNNILNLFGYHRFVDFIIYHVSQ